MKKRRVASKIRRNIANAQFVFFGCRLVGDGSVSCFCGKLAGDGLKSSRLVIRDLIGRKDSGRVSGNRLR